MLLVVAMAVAIGVWFVVDMTSHDAPDTRPKAEAPAQPNVADAPTAQDDGTAAPALEPDALGEYADASRAAPGAGRLPETPQEAAPPVAATPSQPAAKAEQTPAPAKKVARATPRRAPKTSVRIPKGPVTIEKAALQFESFAKNWVQRVQRNLRNRASKMQLRHDAGEWVASYTEVQDASLETKVKPSSSRVCPYIGVLRYHEYHYEARGASEDAVRNGPFTPVKRVRVTEIFRYDTGRWMN